MEPIYFASPVAFRGWLEANHDQAEVVLVGFFKKGTGQPSLTWSDSVDEALCFGWIDGVRRTVDAERYTIRFTPRKAGSVWSKVNVAKVQVLRSQGRMRPAGDTAFELRREGRSGIYAYEQPKVELAESDQAIFRADARAWTFFQDQPAGYRHSALWWVVSAKQAKTRQGRLATLVSCSARAERLPHLAPRKPAGRPGRSTKSGGEP